jgi:ferredoxin
VSTPGGLASTDGTARIVADRDRSVGAGMCVAALPALFDQDDDGLVAPLAERVPAGLDDAVHRAVRLCPSRALRVLVG